MSPGIRKAGSHNPACSSPSMSLPSQAHGGRNIPAPSCQGTPCSLQSRDGLRWGSGGFGALLPHFPWEGECFEVQLHFVHKSWVSVQDVLPQSGLCESAAAGLCLEQWWQVAPCPSVLARALQGDGHSSVAQLCLCRAQPGSNRALVPVIPPSNLGVAEPREDRAGLAVCPQGWEHPRLCSLPALSLKGLDGLENPTRARTDPWALLPTPESAATFQLTCSPLPLPHPPECQSKAPVLLQHSWALKAAWTRLQGEE